MLTSMTVFVKATLELENKKVSIEIKSLNSKQLDIFTRIPNLYKEKDLVLRNDIKKYLERGKVELSIFIESVGTEKETKINQPIVESYYRQLQDLSDKLNISIDNEPLLSTIIKLPDSLKVEQQALDESEWEQIHKSALDAISELNNFRSQENNGLYTNTNDKRGVIHLWGSIVQQKRGYLLRNYPGPYNVSPGVGYDKNFHYDWNLRMNPPPYYPDQVDVNNNVILKMASYGELSDDS